MMGDLVTVRLNDTVVIDKAQLAGVSKSGPVMLMHAGDRAHPRHVQYRNIMIKELK